MEGQRPTARGLRQAHQMICSFDHPPGQCRNPRPSDPLPQGNLSPENRTRGPSAPQVPSSHRRRKPQAMVTDRLSLPPPACSLSIHTERHPLAIAASGVNSPGDTYQRVPLTIPPISAATVVSRSSLAPRSSEPAAEAGRQTALTPPQAAQTRHTGPEPLRSRGTRPHLSPGRCRAEALR